MPTLAPANIVQNKEDKKNPKQKCDEEHENN